MVFGQEEQKNRVGSTHLASGVSVDTPRRPPCTGAFAAPARRKRDVIIVGGGHNALVSAAYLARRGLDVLLLERRAVLGGAAVTEEVVPGFRFSRASYLAGAHAEIRIIRVALWKPSRRLV